MASRFLVLRGSGASESAKKMSKLPTSVQSNSNRRLVQVLVEDILKPLKIGTVRILCLEKCHQHEGCTACLEWEKETRLEFRKRRRI